MRVITSGHGIYGECRVETNEIDYWVIVMNSKYGPYSSLEAAMVEFRKWC